MIVNTLKHTKLLSILPISTLAFLSQYSLAQTGEGDATKAEYTLGLGVASLPEFDGAKDNKTRVLPIINIRYGRLTIGGVNGISYELTNLNDFRISATTGYFQGRDESDASYLFGLGDIESSLTAGVAVNKSLGAWRFGMNISRDFSDDVGGITASLSTGYSFRISKQLLLSFGSSLSWMNSSHAEGVYGITNEQSAVSILPSFDAQSGLQSAGVSVTGLYFVDKHWTITTLISQSKLLGDAKESPISRGDSPYFVMSGFSYKF